MIEIIYFFLIAISAYLFGNFVFKFFKLEVTFLEEIIFSVTFGFALYSYFTFLLGILGDLYAWIFWIVILSSILLGYKKIFLCFKNLYANFKNVKLKLNFETFLIALILIFVLLSFLSALVPPFLWDELDYNLAIPKIYARHHEIIPLFSIWRSEFPFNINMLFVIGLLLKNGILAKLFSWSYSILLALAIYTFGKRFYNKKTALIGASIYLSLPMIVNHIGSSYIDIPVAFLVFMSVYCLIIWINYNKNSWLWMSAVMTGLSIASKHTALFFAVTTTLLAIFFLFKKEKYSAIKKIIAYGLIVLLFALPWYVRSYIDSGNPIWPYANDIFKGHYWDDRLTNEFIHGYKVGYGNSIIDFIKLPWNLTMDSSAFVMLLGWNAIFLAFVPLLLFYKKIKNVTFYLLVHSILSTVIWFRGLRAMRYLAIYPALSLISADVVNDLLNKKIVRKIIIFLLLITYAFSIVLWLGIFGSKMSYVFGLESEEGFYSKLNDRNGYLVFDYINKNLPKESIIFLFRESRGYLSDKDYIVGLPNNQKVIDYSKINNEEDFYRQLKQNKITHVLVNTGVEAFKPGRVVKNQPTHFTEGQQNIMDNLLKKYGRLIFENNGVYLYELN